MPSANRRSRSTTTASTQSAPRPLSRGSTTSVPSAHAPNVNADSRPSTAYNPPPQHHNYGQPQQQYAQVDPASQAIHAQPSGEGLSVDASLAAWNHQYGDQQLYAMPNGIAPHVQLPQESFEQMQDVQYNYGSQHASQVSVADDKPKKGSASSATNDKELREMLTKSGDRSLKDVASEVISTERTSRAEKTKQLFAMIWLKTACKAAKTSVPRSRVYSTYADTCANERVQPLNPASFGKLVRVIFPGLQTRRLGIRGESKYHYVDLALVVDHQADYPDYERRGSAVPESRPMHSHRNSIAMDFNSMPRMPADTAAFPATDGAQDAKPPAVQPPQVATSGASHGRLFANPYDNDVNTRSPTSSSYKQTLKFPPQHDFIDESEVIELPNIHDYTPPRTDYDAAGSLAALYRTHCTSLVDCVRYCKEKQFFRLYGTFSGTLTVPVQKLFEHPTMAPWIRECDILMYQKMTHFISQLTLAVVPPVVLRFLDTVSKTLHGHISKIFTDKPAHVLEAKLEPATLFAGLLHRMLRVNAAAHAAATLLMQDQYRDAMWQDWVAFVNPKRVMESELPDCGYEEAYKILTYDVRMMLQPLSTPFYMEEGTHFHQAAVEQHQQNFREAMSSETVIERIANFLSSLSSRFPEASTRTILHCVSAVGTAALREITVENGTSYNPWWITKVFVDEMSLWLASLGGFLDHKPPPSPRELASRQQADTPLLNGRSASHSSSEHGGRSRQSSNLNSPALQQMPAAGEAAQSASGALQQAPAHQPPTGQFSFHPQHRAHPQHQHQHQHHHYAPPHQLQPHQHLQQQQVHAAPPIDKAPIQTQAVQDAVQAAQDDDSHDDSGIGMSLMDDSAIELAKFDVATMPLPQHDNSNSTRLLQAAPI